MNWKKPKNLILALMFLILILGTFLRLYDFSDLLRFNDDQVRDAIVVEKITSGEELPFLGPKAGGTKFNLGPIFYYLHAFSALLFGNSPQGIALATPILSIASILLFFLLMRHFFSPRIALTLSFLYSISFFAIKYSRFAWNPNDIPFFLILFLLLIMKIKELKQDKNPWWLIASLGALIGIGSQLHGWLLVVWPAGAIIFFLFFFQRNWKQKISALILTGLVALLFNFPLFWYDFRSGGENILSLIHGASGKIETEEGSEASVWKNAECLVQGNVFVLSSLRNSDKCDIFNLKDDGETLKNISVLSFGLIVVLGGIILSCYYLKKESDKQKKFFLQIILGYLGLFFLALVPIDDTISLRMLMVILPVPFVFLGLIFKFVEEKFSRKGMIFIGFIVLSLVFFNLKTFNLVYFAPLENDDEYGGYYGGFKLKNGNLISKYIATHTDSKDVFVANFEYQDALGYLLKKENIKLHSCSEEECPDGHFIIKKNFSQSKRKKLPESSLFQDSKDLGKYTIFQAF